MSTKRRSARLAQRVEEKVAETDVNKADEEGEQDADLPQPTFRRNAAFYLVLILLSGYGIYRLFNTVFPRGLAAEEGCAHVWEAIGLARGSSIASSAMSTRIGIIWECGEKVRGIGALSIYACLWICLKALAIPGSMILCVALGGLVEPIQAQIIATVCEVVGGSLCFFFSGLMGEPLLKWCAPRLLKKFRAETQRRIKKGELFYFALWARMTPLIPNWFVNAASPLTGIPYPVFAVTMTLGIQIATFLSIRTGALLFALGRNTTNGDSFINGQAIQNFLILLVAQFVALIPLKLAPKDMIDNDAKEK